MYFLVYNSFLPKGFGTELFLFVFFFVEKLGTKKPQEGDIFWVTQ